MPREARPRQRHIDREGFDALLQCLDPVRERAGEKYESIRSRLLRFFRGRAAPWPEELTDETIDRVCRKLVEGETIHAADVGRYFLGVARNLLHEAWDRERRRAGADVVTPPDRAVPRTEAESASFDCLERCLEALPPESRDVLLRYYGADGAQKAVVRRELAGRLGVGANALRIRMHRLRTRLEDCVHNCLDAGGRETSVVQEPPSL